MIKYPMFGQDSIPQKTSRYIALIGTGIFWLIFLVCSFVIKPQNKKPKYNTVQIVLSSTPEAKKNETAKAESTQKAPVPVQEVAPAPEPAKPAASKPKTEPAKTVTQKTTAKPAPKPAVKPAPSPAPKQNTAPAKVVEQTYARDYSEDFDFDTQTSTSKKVPDFDWSDFDDDAPVTNNQTSAKTVKTNNSIEASNAVVSDYSNNAVTSSTKGTSQNQNNSTSEGTASALSSIASSSASVNHSSSPKTGSDTNTDRNFTFRSGEARILLEPLSPTITISDENKNKLNSYNIEVSFTIESNGTVLVNTITLLPSQNPAISEEVKNQVGKWRFSNGSGNANATFKWNIKLK